MGNLYNKIFELCEVRGISTYRLCKDIGIRGSVLSDLKTGRKQGLSAKTLTAISGYFHVTTDFLLGTEALTGEKKELAESGEFISPEKQQLMSLIDTLSDEQCRRLAGIIEEAKKLL